MSFDIKNFCCVERTFSLRGGEELEYNFKGLGVFCCTKGRCTVICGDKEFPSGEGSIVCLGSSGSVSCGRDSSVSGILIAGIIADRFAKEINGFFRATEMLSPFISSQVVRLSGNLPDYSDSYAINSAFELLNSLSSDSRRDAISSRVIVDAVNLIKANYSTVYGVEELARTLGISKSHLVREFCKYTGTTPGKYLNTVRIDAVKRLLVNTSMSLNAIARKTGFSGDNYLCKAFKKATGETPIAYKNRIIASQYLPNQMVLSGDFVDF